MSTPETEHHLLFVTLSDLKSGVSKLNDKMDNLNVDVTGLKERHPFYAEKLNYIEGRLGVVEDLSNALKEKQNVIYTIAGLIAATVTFFVTGFKQFIAFFNNGV